MTDITRNNPLIALLLRCGVTYLQTYGVNLSQRCVYAFEDERVCVTTAGIWGVYTSSASEREPIDRRTENITTETELRDLLEGTLIGAQLFAYKLKLLNRTIANG